MKVNKVDTIYYSIKNAAHLTGLSEYYLRTMLKAGNLPGVYSGRKFMVDVPALLDSLKNLTWGNQNVRE
ncbi:MAG: helix-turn-helix domain-containing protein [Clostridiales bacterium]|nr:helix-turn-helix domain-containing protein [Clostridiales bacterium]